MRTELLKYLSERFQEDITKMSNDLARGTAKDHGDYKYICGVIRGLMTANAHLQETAERIDKDDD